MSSSQIREQIDKMGDLPSLPQTLLSIQKVAADVNSGAEDLAKCILQDQALTMRVLKVVNSARYQRSNQEEILTVQRAVVVMGFQTVKKMALGLSVFDMMSKLSRSPQLMAIARHSLITAGFARILAQASGKVSPDEAFVTGLIHDIGKVVLIECDPKAMDQVLQEMTPDAHLPDIEKKHFGISHDRAGRRLAARWGLPSDLQKVIAEHHNVEVLKPPKGMDPLLAAIVFANAMAEFTCAVENLPREHRIMRKAGRILGIAVERLDDIHERVLQEIEDLASVMGFQVNDMADYSLVVNVDGSNNVAPREMDSDEIARRTAAQLNLYQQVGQGVAEGQCTRELAGKILQGAVDTLGFERVIYFKVDRLEKILYPEYWAGPEADELAELLILPLKRQTGTLALSVFEHRPIHVPQAWGPDNISRAGDTLLHAAQCSGFAVAPVVVAETVVGVIYGDRGDEGPDVVVEQAQELVGLALQMGMVLTSSTPIDSFS